MKNIKRILSILVVCAMLLMVMPFTVSAEGTQDNPINANDKWFGSGVDCYLLNPTIAEGTTDGLWYELTIEQDGILYLEHKYKDVDYTITVSVDGLDYEGGSVDGVIYNGPIMTLPVQVGYVATIHIVTKDAAAGTVYASMNVITGDADDPIKVKSAGIMVYVGAGETVYFQDDSLNAVYATKGLLVEGSVSDTVFYTVSVNSTSGAVAKKAFTDTDDDGAIEAKLGGSLGSAGAPPVKPMWAIENNTTVALGTLYFLTIVDDAHECVYDDDTDADCNTCGALRALPTPCEHNYEAVVTKPSCSGGGYTTYTCSDCGDSYVADHTEAVDHVYENVFDDTCDVCSAHREAAGITVAGSSISEDVNGLAVRYKATVEGMEMNGATAIYDNATIGGYKLVSMGAVVWNDGADTHVIEDADGKRITNVPAVYLCDLSESDASYAVRLINIPDEHKDTRISFRSYFIYEDEEGVQHTVYGQTATGTYNAF